MKDTSRNIENQGSNAPQKELHISRTMWEGKISRKFCGKGSVLKCCLDISDNKLFRMLTINLPG
jgi:hypothetical protein